MRNWLCAMLSIVIATVGMTALPDVIAPSAALANTGTFAPAASADDAEQRTTQTNLGSTDLDITHDGSTAQQAIGLRLPAVSIPQFATVTSAHLQFTAHGTSNGTASFTIRGQASSSSAPFNSAENDITARPRTASRVSWAPSAWSQAGERGAAQRTPNLAPVVQEIVNRDSWDSRDPMVFIMTGTGRRNAESWDRSTSGHWTLSVSWTPPTPTATATATPTATATSAPTVTPTRGARMGTSIPAAYLYRHADGQAYLDARLNEVQALGIKWLRTSIHWQWEEHNGPNTINWTHLDALTAGAEARGINLLIDIVGNPAWNRPSGSTEVHGPSTAGQRAAYVDFYRRVATRYAATVDAWEVWNEANLDQFWSPSPSITDYTALLKETYPVVKAADPNSPVLSSGSGSGPAPDIASDVWYRGIYANGGGTSFDVANIHPYQDWRLSAGTGNHHTGHMALVDDVRMIMSANGDAAKPMWGTEWGAPTSGDYATTEAGQQVIYTGGRDHWFGLEPKSVLFFYFLRDRAPVGASTSRSPYWGLIRSDGSHKPAYAAMTNWLRGS